METLKTYYEMIANEGWTNKDRIPVSAVQSLTFKASLQPHLVPTSYSVLLLSPNQLALLIIGKCGFGFPFTWSEPARTSDGRMSVQEALRINADTFIINTFAPAWTQMLPIKR